MDPPVYLDHNATTPLLASVAEAMRQAERLGFANPSSQHAAGRAARRIVERAREGITRLLGGEAGGDSPDRLVFTSGGTEANTLALRGLLAGRPQRLIVSAIEHPSVSETADRLAAEGVRVDRLGVDADGVAQADRLARLLDDPAPVGLVSVMLASNETGVVQPIQRLTELSHRGGALFHTDASQGVGRIGVAFRRLGVDALTFSTHKHHGPLGVGGLLLRGATRPTPQLYGGHQQEGLRPGTESAPLAAGALAALIAWSDEAAERHRRMASLRDRLEEGLAASAPGGEVIGRRAERLPNTTCVAWRGADRQALAMAFDLAGVACSTGSACASGSSQPSPTLVAMGLDPGLVGGAVRFSLGAETTPGEIDLAIERIGAAMRLE